MAGAGYKLFNTGDVLTAAQVNTYLQEQAVMRFANAAARTTALSGVLAEGMVSYLDDTNQLEVYDGSTWTSASGDITGVTAGTGISGGGTSGTVTITNSMATEITAAGDIIVGTGSGTFDNLPIGTTGQVLTADTTVSPYKVKWAAAGGSSKVVQIVNATNGTQTIVSSSTFGDSNLSATITPTSASNKILVFVNQSSCGKYNSNTVLQVRLVRNSTTILNIDSAGGNTSSTATNVVGSISATYLDSPATTSAVTYKTQIASQANVGSAYVNDATSPGSNSSITLMEVTP